jgi:uncharacterized protein DUF1566
MTKIIRTIYSPVAQNILKLIKGRRELKMKRFNCIITMLFFTTLMLCVVPTYAATYIVTNTNDSGVGSLRQAIFDSNATAEADTINFGVTGAITLSSSLTQIVYSLTINGPGAENLTINGASAYQLFFFSGPMGPPSQTFHISGLNLTGGSRAQGGAISLASNQTLTVDSCILSGNEATTNGGGISCWGNSTLIVQNSTVSGNDATTSGGGISIEDDSIVTIDNVTISSNTASIGGGIYNDGNSLNISNSTISNNGPVNSGGGIYNSGGTMILTNVTISGNTANVGGGISTASSTLILYNVTISNNTGNNNGGGIYNGGTVTFQNAIIANNLGSGNNCGDAGGGIFNSVGHNLDSEDTCRFNQPNDIINTDPLLGTLYNNGGDTKTHALLLNSPAIDAGENYSGTPSTDQRGFLRPQDGDDDGSSDKDMGAFEVFTGTVSLPQTGQTGCWDEAGNPCICGASGCSGHDGSIQAGVAWPSPRFTDNGNGTVTDNLTGLVWAKSPLNTLRTWANALSYADSLTLGGHNDWRLPNINELESLVHAQEADQAAWLNTQGFTNVLPDYYWSSTTLSYNSSSAWFVDMEDGRASYSTTNPMKIHPLPTWPVRAGHQDQPDTDYPANQWKTGQTVIDNPVDDGAFQMGMMIPSSARFTDNGDGTVTDNLTGLMWLKDANCMETHYAATWPTGFANWQEAQNIIAGINDGTYTDCSAGHTDWRLPNRKELHSLTDFSQSGPALPTGYPFVNVELGPPGFRYMSSTTYHSSTERFWGVDIGSGQIFGAHKTDGTNWIWPVRAGLSGNGSSGDGGGGGGSSGGGCFISTSIDVNSK